MPSTIGKTNDPIGNHRPPANLPAARRPGGPSGASVKFAVLLTPLLKDRRLTAILVMAALLLTGLSAAGLNAWPCPINAVFSIPCPACGLTSGVLLLLQGQWTSALQMHLFSPLLLAAAVLTGLLVLMPTSVHRGIVQKIEALERSTAATQWIGVCLGVSWIWRLAAVI